MLVIKLWCCGGRLYGLGPNEDPDVVGVYGGTPDVDDNGGRIPEVYGEP